MSDQQEARALHVMVDVEARVGFQIDPAYYRDATITAIGACPFVLDPAVGERAVYDEEAEGWRCNEIGYVDPDCDAWWAKQSDEARKYAFPRHDDGCVWSIVSSRASLLLCLLRYAENLRIEGDFGPVHFWSHYYDRSMLQAVAANKLPVDDAEQFRWHRWKDYGTLMHCAARVGYDEAESKVVHDPVEDAVAQALNVVRVIKNNLRPR